MKPNNSDKAAHEFMRRSDNAVAARDNLIREVEQRGLKSKQELEKFARTFGYMKTDVDVKVFRDVAQKLKLRDDMEYARNEKMKQAIDKELRKGLEIDFNITDEDRKEMVELHEQGQYLDTKR